MTTSDIRFMSEVVARLRRVRSDLVRCCGRRPTVALAKSAAYGYWFHCETCNDYGEEPYIWNTLKGRR